MARFKELRVWQEARALVKEIYTITSNNHFSRDFGLTNQMRRAAISIVSNIAEGDQLGTSKQAIQHFTHARGSAAELQTQVIVSCDIDYLDEDRASDLEEKCMKIAAMLNSLIRARRERDHQ